MPGPRVKPMNFDLQSLVLPKDLSKSTTSHSEKSLRKRQLVNHGEKVTGNSSAIKQN